jgi:hypothetical protein
MASASDMSPIPVLNSGMLAVGDEHTLYFEVCGAATAPKTACFLHGGPGLCS